MEHSIERIYAPSQKKIAAEFINAHHSYIQYADRPSRQLYWNLLEDGKMVGVFALSSVFDKPKDVKRYMEAHKLESNEVGNNIVYCLFGHQHRNAGSIFLKLVRNDAILWWWEKYANYLKAYQTFILPPRTGAVYKADNWELIGKTLGQSQHTTGINRQEYEAMKKEGKKNAQK